MRATHIIRWAKQGLHALPSRVYWRTAHSASCFRASYTGSSAFSKQSSRPWDAYRERNCIIGLLCCVLDGLVCNKLHLPGHVHLLNIIVLRLLLLESAFKTAGVNCHTRLLTGV